MSRSSSLIYPTLLPLVLLLLLPPLARSDLGAYYTKNPESISAPIGDEVVFSCQTNIDADPMAWRFRPSSGSRGWREVKSSGPNDGTSAQWVTSRPPVSRLTVHLHNESLAGEYRCISWYGSSALMSVAARLGIAKMNPLPKMSDVHLQIAPGGTALIRCPSPVSEPPASILYFKMVGDKKEVVGSEALQGADGALLVKPRESSVYTCDAINDLSQETFSFNHKIYVDVRDGPTKAPSFPNDMPVDVHGVVGSSIDLACGALGSPVPRISWRKVGSHSSRVKSALFNIVELKSEDEGVYLCEAINSAGHAEKSVHLSVLSPPNIYPVMQRPHSSTTLLSGSGGTEERINEVWAKEGTSVKVPCGRVTGKPTPTIEWTVNEEEISNVPNVKINGDNELEINPVEKRHAGVVQCFANNSLGSATAFKYLRVVPKEQISQGGGGEPGHEEMGVIRPGQQGGNGRRHSRPKGHNHRGNVMIPPSRPNVTRLTDQSVMVRWTVPHNDGLAIRFFKVQHKDLNQSSPGGSERGSEWMTSNQDVLSHIRSYEVDGLEPDHVYKFRISAVYSNNDNKQGKNSGRFLLQRGTGLARAPPAPQLTKAEPISPTEIKLYWQLPNPPTNVKETPVEGFYVYYRMASSAGDYVKAAVEGGKARSLILRHLTPATPYEIKLQSFTPAVASDFSAIITQKTLKAPVVEKPAEAVLSSGSGSADGGSGGSGKVYLIAGGAAGGLAVLGAIGIAVFIYKKKKGGEDPPTKQRDGGVGGGGEIGNGFLPSAQPSMPTITITPNPLHHQGENVDLEMSYISAQNNNCSSQSPRSSGEVVANTCRSELRKQGAVSLPTRENYV